VPTPGFRRQELQARYNVSAVEEDRWHSFGDVQRRHLIRRTFDHFGERHGRILNAGSGVHTLGLGDWEEIAIDFFERPLHRTSCAVCGNIAQLPFGESTFDAVICVGEVLGYCDPPQAVAEFFRVIRPQGILFCDFGSTQSARYWFTEVYRRAAEMVTVEYNGEPERIWIYDPDYINSLLRQAGFCTILLTGIYRWAALFAQLCGQKYALKAEQLQRLLPFPSRSADVVVIVARRL
jgi:SAM-dependent methyltransferase